MSKRTAGSVLTVAAMVLALAGCSWVEQTTQRLWPVAAGTATPLVAVTQGQVRDAITKLPISAAQLRTASVTALSDVEGGFSVRSLADDRITISAAGYESQQIGPRPGFPLIIDLVPDPVTTFQHIYDLEKHHEFGREYDLLHPDMQALFSREDFIRYMEQNRPYDIVDVSVGAMDMLVSGMVLGKVYEDVAQVRVQASVRVGQETVRRGWLAYAAKADGLWRWFRGPLLWPTPQPTP
jgi:hypothetical protein